MNNVKDNLFNITYKKNIPLTTIFELTSKCNLKCVHCYLNKKNILYELSTKEIKNVLIQLKSLGCLYLVFTGGEIFLRKDILELCKFARNLNFDLHIFTNATLLTEDIIKYLHNISVYNIDISLYGRKKTHDKIVRKNGSFNKTVKSINLLKKYNFNISIKCPIMNINYNDIEWLISFAKKQKINYKFDPVITPKNNGNTSPLKYNIDNEKLKVLLLKYFKYIKKPEMNYSKNKFENLYCSAGKNLIGISSDGTVYPCIQFLLPLGNIKKYRLKKILNNSRNILKVSPKEYKVCYNCSKLYFCRRCPGIVYNQTGDFRSYSELLCNFTDIISKNT